MSALLSVQRTDPTLPITQFIFKVNTRQIQCKMRNLSSPTVSFSAPKLLGKPWLQNLGQQFFLRFKVTQPKTARIFSYLSSSSSAITSYFPSEQSDNNSSELHQWLLRWRIHCRFLSLNWIELRKSSMVKEWKACALLIIRPAPWGVELFQSGLPRPPNINESSRSSCHLHPCLFQWNDCLRQESLYYC